MRIFILGPPGSGKTTQAQKLSEFLGVCMIETGQLLREISQSGGDMGQKIHDTISAGLLVEDRIVSRLIQDRVAAPDCQNGFVMDGYPRTIEQLGLYNPDFDRVFYLKVRTEESIRRMLARNRADDIKEVIEKRIEVQRKEIETVLGYFKSMDILIPIEGETNIEQVHKQILAALK